MNKFWYSHTTDNYIEMRTTTTCSNMDIFHKQCKTTVDSAWLYLQWIQNQVKLTDHDKSVRGQWLLLGIRGGLWLRGTKEGRASGMLVMLYVLILVKIIIQVCSLLRKLTYNLGTFLYEYCNKKYT